MKSVKVKRANKLVTWLRKVATVLAWLSGLWLLYLIYIDEFVLQSDLRLFAGVFAISLLIVNAKSDKSGNNDLPL